MATRQQNLEAWKGATFKQVFRLLNNDRTPKDLTTTAVSFEFGVPGDDTPIATAPAQHKNADGQVLIYIADEVTSAWKPGKYFWVLVTETAGGEINFEVSGTFTVKAVSNV